MKGIGEAQLRLEYSFHRFSIITIDGGAATLSDVEAMKLVHRFTSMNDVI